MRLRKLVAFTQPKDTTSITPELFSEKKLTFNTGYKIK